MRDSKEETVIGLLEQGATSKGYAVEVLGITHCDINHLLKIRGIRLGPSEEQVRESQEAAKYLQQHKRRCF